VPFAAFGATLNPVTTGPIEFRIPLRDNITLRALEWSTGAGTPILLVHGLASNARLWDGPARHLVALGHSVIAIDLRGHGHSDKTDHGYAMADIADDVADVLHFLTERDQAFTRPLVIGQSWGGNIVIELAHRHANLVRGVVAVDGGTIELGAAFPAWNDCAEVMSPPPLIGMKAERLRSYIRTAHPDWSEEGIDGQMHNMEILEDGTIRPWLTLDRHLKVLHGLWEHTPSSLWSSIQVPVMFTPAAKTNDDFTQRKREQLRVAEASLAQARVEWFEPADHDLHAQFPERFAHVIHDAITSEFFA
jgi:pimeloyl-ACP methyl ester carboxylesterase